MAMTRDELINILVTYAADDYKEEQDALIESIVDDAIEEVCHAMFPFADECTESHKKTAVAKHPSNIRRIMEYHYDKIGKEGVTTFYEAGQTTSWESGGTPDSFFKGIIPQSRIV